MSVWGGNVWSLAKLSRKPGASPPENSASFFLLNSGGNQLNAVETTNCKTKTFERCGNNVYFTLGVNYNGFKNFS